MLYQDKYKAVVESILEKSDPVYIELTIASDKNLKNKLTKHELSEILDDLQYKQGVIVVHRRGPHQKPTIKGWGENDKITGERLPIVHDPFEENKSYDFALKRLPQFRNWHSAFLTRINTSIENMDIVKLRRLSLLIKAINNEFQKNLHPDIEFSMLLDCEGELMFLKDKSIVLKYIHRESGAAGFRIRLELDVDNFMKFLPRLKNACLKRYKNQTTDAINIPPDTKWEDITIKFVDGHNVNIQYKDTLFRSDYKEMGFEDKKDRNRKPNQQWQFLIELSENNGEKSWDAPNEKNTNFKKAKQSFGDNPYKDHTKNPNRGFSIIKAPDKYKKKKQQLAQTLKAFFKINEAPFWPYRQVKAYKIKLKLIPS